MNRDKVYRNSLITCTVMLIVCIILKLFGVPWLNLNTKIGWLNKLDDIILNNNMMMFFYSFLLLFINGYLVCIITTKVSRIKRYLIPLSVACLISMFTKILCDSHVLCFVIDTLSLFLVSWYVKGYDSSYIIKEYAITFLLNVMYQIIFMNIRSIDYVVYYNVTTGMLMLSDYYTMLVLTYLYLKKGGVDLWEELFHHFGLSLRKQLCTMRSKGLKHYLTNKKESD